MDIETFWQDFKNRHPEIKTNHHDTYAMGSTDENATILAHLIARGIKTATTSAVDLYGPDEPLPFVGEYNVILDGHDQPICVTQTKVVETIPFNQVSAEHAYHEGEDDRTLASWRREHRAFFQAAYQQEGQSFTEEIPCCCEVFERID